MLPKVVAVVIEGLIIPAVPLPPTPQNADPFHTMARPLNVPCCELGDLYVHITPSSEVAPPPLSPTAQNTDPFQAIARTVVLDQTVLNSAD